MKYVLGHKNPDTDAICSAIVYAQYLNDQGQQAQSLALGKANNETMFVLEKRGVDFPEVVHTLPAGSEIILVDHNEAGQSIDQREQCQIVGVIDHHKVADFSTAAPLMMRLTPRGSTCTVIADIFAEQGYQPSQQIAGLMISAILSDTLYFRSPTSTDHDRSVVEYLNTIAQIGDLEAYSMEMFNAKSDIASLSAKELVTADYKIFDFGGHKVGIGVHETTNPTFALERKQEILTAIAITCEEAGVEYVLFCLIDILNEQNTLFVVDDKTASLVESVYGVTAIDSVADLQNRISRKKQIVPPLSEYLS